jgi:RNA polymerase sigma-70 factor (ECF subfamily)
VAADFDCVPNRDVFRRWRFGDKEVWSELVLGCADLIRRRVRRILCSDIDDVVQDVVVALLGSGSRFRGETIGELHSFFLRTAFHKACAEVRRRKALEGNSCTVDEFANPAADGADHSLTRFEEAWHKLGVDQRHLLELAYWRNLRRPQIASVLGIPEGTASSRLRLARRALKRLLSDPDSGMGSPNGPSKNDNEEKS